MTIFKSEEVPHLIYLKTKDKVYIPLGASLVIGRDPGDDGFRVVPELTTGISRIHAEIYGQLGQPESGAEIKVFIKDIGTDGNGSPGGTFVNNARLEKITPRELNHKDIIRIGPLGGEEFRYLSGAITYEPGDVVLAERKVYVRGTELPEFTALNYCIFELLVDKSPHYANFDEIGLMWAKAAELIESIKQDGTSTDIDGPDTRTKQKTVQRLRAFLDEQLAIKNSIKAVRDKGYRLDIFV